MTAWKNGDKVELHEHPTRVDTGIVIAVDPRPEYPGRYIVMMDSPHYVRSGDNPAFNGIFSFAAEHLTPLPPTREEVIREALNGHVQMDCFHPRQGRRSRAYGSWAMSRDIDDLRHPEWTMTDRDKDEAFDFLRRNCPIRGFSVSECESCSCPTTDYISAILARNAELEAVAEAGVCPTCFAQERDQPTDRPIIVMRCADPYHAALDRLEER